MSPAKDSETGFNPKLSLAWSDSPDFMAYVLGSEGYRFGTPNVQGLSKYAVPSGSDSDSLRNYELGMRSRWLDGRVTVDATLFAIDWRDIQLRLQTPDFINYATNGGKARSTGVEIAASWRPVDSFEWSTSITAQRARLVQDLTILYYGTAPSGSRLPGSADWSVSNLFTYRFGGPYSPSLSLSQQFLSKGISDLNSAVPGTSVSKQGGYNLFDVRYAMNIGSTDLSLWSTNVADRRGITRSVPETNGMGEGIVRPRTFGLTAHWQY